MGEWSTVGQKAWAAILGRVQALKAEGKTLQEIANIVGVSNRSLIGEWLNGNREAANAPFPNMMMYLENLGFDYADFFPARSKNGKIRRTGSFSPQEQVTGENLPRIPVMGGTGAGDDVEIFEATPSHWITVLPQYVHPQLIGLVVVGDSMEPTIKRGAVVGIVPCDGSLTEGGIYLVHRPPFGLTIKRVQMGTGQQISLHSDNPTYAPMEVPFEGYADIIKGRVVWIWQEC